MSDFVRQQYSVCSFSDSNSWVILSPIEQSIKRKIEAIGVPLKDWDIQINYGIKTGLNDAFIITTVKRDEILANCQTKEERQRTTELIRPILRGRDIKRYGYVWDKNDPKSLWLINTHNGVRGKYPRIDINNYPALKQHLDKYWDKISIRADQGDTPYNLRNCAYLEDFLKPKIVWGEISDKSKFAFDFFGNFTPEATTFYMKGADIEFLLCALNSSISEWMFSKVGTTTGVGTVRWKKYTVEQLLVGKPSTQMMNNYMESFEKLKKQQIPIEEFEKLCDKFMFDLYGLTQEEISFILKQ